MDTRSITADYVRFCEIAFLLVRDPIAAEVVALDAVAAAKRKPLAPDAPPGLLRARRKLAQHAISYMRRRRVARLLPWTKKAHHDLELPEATQRVWDAVGGLRLRQQVAVVMARVEGANLAEISDALEFSTSAASSHLDRAREGLRRKLGPEVDLRATLTRELAAVTRAYTAAYRPDPPSAEPLFVGRWKAWTIGAGIAAVAGGVLASLFLR